MEYTSPILVLIALWLFVADFFTYRRHKQKFPVLIVMGIVCIIVAALIIP